MNTELLFFFTNVLLIAYLFYRERGFRHSLRTILIGWLSRDAGELRTAIEETGPVEEEESQPAEIPLEDADPKEMLGAFNKK